MNDKKKQKPNSAHRSSFIVHSALVTVQVRHRRWKTRLKPYGKTVRSACEAALSADFPPPARGGNKRAMTVVLADDAFIRELNKTYRGIDKPTNVLSFPESRIPNPEPCSGDIVLALETVEREAKDQGKSFRDHATHLLVHGTLHLLGFDHEKDRDAARMEALEIKILEKLGIRNPYL